MGGDKDWIAHDAATDLILSTSPCSIIIDGLPGDQYTVKLLSSIKVAYQIVISIGGVYGSGSDNGAASDSWDPMWDGWANSQWIEWQDEASEGGILQIDFDTPADGDYACVNALCLVNTSSLPVRLSSFSARQRGYAVELTWITESETDHAGFILERMSCDGEWRQIASHLTHQELKGRGNSSESREYTFTDADISGQSACSYRLSDVDNEGTVTVKDVLSITLDDVPLATDLLPAVPNPFNPATRIKYSLAEEANVNLSVVDMMGRMVQTIISGQNRTAGCYSIHWNGRNDAGQDAASGIYLLVLKAGSVRKTQKVMLVR